MLSRYARQDMARIWSRQEQLRIWYHIEAHAVDALARIGRVPPDLAERLWQAEPDRFDEDRIAAIESVVRHESIAFQTYVMERLDDDIKQHYHFGMTSSDVLDTCLSIQLTRSSDLLLTGLDDLASVLGHQAGKYRHTLCMGRSHGVHAEPVTFGLKLLRAYAECRRNIQRLEIARKEVAFGKLSGSMGTYSCIDPRIEEHVCKQLGLAVEPVASQVIPRDRHATFYTTLAIIASALERLATELRFLQITEISEIEEGFTSSQRGSSAMPHKKNPILSENITGLARIMRSHVLPSLENISLWQERDMSHSSVERFTGPDATVTLDYAIHRMKGIIDNIKVNPSQMLRNAEATQGAYCSQKIMLALVRKGMGRDEAYRLVQQAAHGTENSTSSFCDRLMAMKPVAARLTNKELASLTDMHSYLVYVDLIFDRVMSQP